MAHYVTWSRRRTRCVFPRGRTVNCAILIAYTDTVLAYRRKFQLCRTKMLTNREKLTGGRFPTAGAIQVAVEVKAVPRNPLSLHPQRFE